MAAAGPLDEQVGGEAAEARLSVRFAEEAAGKDGAEREQGQRVLRHVKAAALVAEGNELRHGPSQAFPGQRGSGRLPLRLGNGRNEAFSVGREVAAGGGDEI